MGFIGRAVAPAPITANDVPDLPASKITSGTFGDSRISASSVSQHATSFDDNKIVNDLSTLGLRVHTQENLNASNTASASFDVFQDSSKITNLTNVSNVDEYLASVYELKTQFIPSFHRTSDYTGALQTASWTGGENTANSSSTTSGNYEGIIINELFDLAGDFQCNMFIGASSQNGSISTQQYNHIAIIISTDTSLTAGSDPDIFTASTASTAYGSNASQFQDDTFLTSSARSSLGTSNLSNSGKFQTYQTSTGTGDQSFDSGGTTFGTAGYYNDGNAWAGFKVVYDKSAQTIVTQPYDGSLNLVNNGKATISNVSQTGRVFIVFGDANNTSRNFQTSYVNGSRTNDDFSFKVSSTANASGSVESTAITASASTSSMGAVITYQDNAGTNTLNTDIILKLSADNGSNYSTATLTALPDFATGIKMAKVNDLSVTSGTQLKYKIEFANQSLGVKEARIRGISLQY
tara:strand:+ start:2270 stop:3664 length:1395 start_codon:yes stop_codon:yes gene_type:complete